MRSCSGIVAIASLIVSLCCMWPLEVSAMHAWDSPPTNGSMFSVRGSIGYLQGEAREYVYDPGVFGFGGQQKISELIWDLSGLMVAGGVVSFSPTKRFGLHAGVWTCITEGNGEMYDYDWAIAGLEWTDRSISGVSIVSSYMADISATYDFVSQQNLSIAVVVGYKQDFWEWEDSLKDILYSVNGFRDYHEVGDGSPGIEYDQTFTIPYAGLSGTARFSRMSLTGYGLYSPFVSAEDNDYHVFRDIYFEETFSGGDYFAAGVAAQFDFSESLFFIISADAQFIPEFTGDIKVTDELGDTYEFADSAGISHQSAMISATLGVRF